MSLLNSVLSSINGGQAAAPAKPVQKPNIAARKDNGALKPVSSQNPIVKRKAEDLGKDVNPKAPRVDSKTSLAPPPSRSATSSPAQRQCVAPLPKSQMPYRGTAGVRPSPASNTASKAATAPASASAGSPSVAATPPASLVPAKSGYLATLERARAAQEAAKSLGQIKHKPVEKLTKKDRQRLQAEALAARKGGKAVPQTSAASGAKPRSRSADVVESKAGGPVKKERKPIDVGYKGTMRAAPAAPSYTGTMRGPGAARKPSASAGPSSKAERGGGERYRYASYSDEEEEEEEDYASDVSSDMEARMDEVYEEEEASARIARKEDLEALREENELKKAKLEKKRKLEQLAAAAAKQKKRY